MPEDSRASQTGSQEREEAPINRKFPEAQVRKLLKAQLPDGIKLRLEFDRKQPWQRSEWEGQSCYRHSLSFTAEQRTRKQTFLAIVYVNALGDVLGLHCIGKGGKVHTVTREDASSRSQDASGSRLKPVKAQ